MLGECGDGVHFGWITFVSLRREGKGKLFFWHLLLISIIRIAIDIEEK